MGLNTKDIQLGVLKVLHFSFEKSYGFMKKYPKVSCALLVFFIVYIFLSCIYNLLVFLSPFLVFTAILLRIFWSSEQTNVKCVAKKRDEKKVDVNNLSKVHMNERRGMLYKYPSQNATSRRRNFTGKKLDVYGDLEQKAKNLSAAFRNEFTKKNTEIKFGVRFKDIDPIDYKFSSTKFEAPKKQLICEPPIVDLVTCGTSYSDGQEKRTEKMEDEKKAIEDNIISNKVVELKEDGPKNLMELGICETETNKRLESLIARRRARKQLTSEIENGLIDMESMSPSQMAPLLIAERMNPFDSPTTFDGIEMPGSAPSALRSPFDIPYEPFEEKPNLKEDNFDQDFIGDAPLELKQDLPKSRFRRPSGMENHDRSEELNSKEESELQAPILSNEGEETIQEEKGKYKIDIFGMKIEEGDNGDPNNSMSYHENEPNLIPRITNFERNIALPPKSQEKLLDFPISSAHVTHINDSLYGSLSCHADKSKEKMFSTNGLVLHTPSLSLASDLHVEFSEIGSPTLTIDESNDEDLWGTNEVSDHDDILEAKNWSDIGSSSISLQNTDEENVDDVNFMPSKSDHISDDTPTYATSIDHNIFGNVRQTGTSQYSSDVLARWKRLMGLMDTSDHLAQETLSFTPRNSENLEEFNQKENSINTEQVMNEANNSEANEHNNAKDTRSNEEGDIRSNEEREIRSNEEQDIRINEESGASNVRQETVDEVSTITSSSSSSSSPTSVLPVPHHTEADQEMHQGVQPSDMEDVAQETVTGEVSNESMSQTIHPSMDDDPNVESHNGDLINSQDVINPLENSIQESNMSNNMNVVEICNQEEQNLKNYENIEDKSTPPSRQDASAEPHRQAEVPLLSPLTEESSFENHMENEGKSEESLIHEASTQHFINAEVVDTSYANDSEEKNKNDLYENEAKNHSLKEDNYLESELKHTVKDHIEKEKLDNGDISGDSSRPMVPEVTINDDDTIDESNKMNKTEGIDQVLHINNQTMDLSEHPRESDEVSNTAHMNDP